MPCESAFESKNCKITKLPTTEDFLATGFAFDIFYGFMFYELNISLKTIRQEGFIPFVKKIFSYFGQIIRTVQFSLLRKPHNGPPEEVVDFSFKAAGGLIRPYQVRSEFLQIATLVQQRKPRVVVEVGTANGATLFAWCALADPQATIISIDLPGGVHGGGYAYWRTAIYKQFAQSGQRLLLLRADSHETETLLRLKKLLPPQGVDFLFIDGDHTYAGVKSDYEMYSPLLHPGGLIAFHDICLHPAKENCHVDKLWMEIRAQKPVTRELIENPAQGWAGIGVIEI